MIDVQWMSWFCFFLCSLMNLFSQGSFSLSSRQQEEPQSWHRTAATRISCCKKIEWFLATRRKKELCKKVLRE
jgi:hypothetical protein